MHRPDDRRQLHTRHDTAPTPRARVYTCTMVPVYVLAYEYSSTSGTMVLSRMSRSLQVPAANMSRCM